MSNAARKCGREGDESFVSDYDKAFATKYGLTLCNTPSHRESYRDGQMANMAVIVFNSEQKVIYSFIDRENSPLGRPMPKDLFQKLAVAVSKSGSRPVVIQPSQDQVQEHNLCRFLYEAIFSCICCC